MVADWSGASLEWKAELKQLKERDGAAFGRVRRGRPPTRLSTDCFRASSARPAG